MSYHFSFLFTQFGQINIYSICLLKKTINSLGRSGKKQAAVFTNDVCCVEETKISRNTHNSLFTVTGWR